MASYLLQVAYTPEAWATMIKNPQNRIDQVRPAVERLGGKPAADKAFFPFGEYDIVAILEFPDNAAAAAFSIAASAGGAVKSIQTTPLMTVAEGIEAAGRVGASGEP